ncbi:hypothetical protein BC826DRAFT_984647, partial [Russula brevipes]
MVRVFSFDFSPYSAPSGSQNVLEPCGVICKGPGQRATVTSGDVNVVHHWQLSGCGSQLGSDGDDREFSAPNLAVLAGSPLVCLSSRAGQLIGSGHGYCFGKRFAIRLFLRPPLVMPKHGSREFQEAGRVDGGINTALCQTRSRVGYTIPLSCHVVRFNRRTRR